MPRRKSSKWTSERGISIGGSPTDYRMLDFWTWASNSVADPMLRGVFIEFLIVRLLYDHAGDIAQDRVQFLTEYTQVDNAALQKSLSPFYGQQPQRDYFDFQLHWGITFEIKSTTDPKKGRLKKSNWWGPLNKQNKHCKVYPPNSTSWRYSKATPYPATLSNSVQSNFMSSEAANSRSPPADLFRLRT